MAYGRDALKLGSLVLILLPGPVHIRLHPAAHSCLPDGFAEVISSFHGLTFERVPIPICESSRCFISGLKKRE